MSHSVLQEDREDSRWGVMQFEHIDWNDIVDAEMSGDSESLLYLKNKSKNLKRSKSIDKQLLSNECLQPSISPLSYAQVVGPEKHGMKRRTSDRLGLSPIDTCHKRSAFSRNDSRRKELGHTPPSQTLCSPDQNTPEGTASSTDDTKCSKGNNGGAGAVQRRLFSSPMADNQARASMVRNSPASPVEELTSHRLLQRQKQIDFGKNTIGYQKFIQTKPKWQRKPSDPNTPEKQKTISTRAWQGQIRLWRRALHAYDPPTTGDSFTPNEAALCEMSPV